MANTNWCYVAYHDCIEKVQIVKRKASTRGLPRDIKDPVLVKDEDGDEFVVSADELYNNPMNASLAMAKMAQQLGGVRANPIASKTGLGPGDEEDEDEEEEDVDDEDELDDEEDIDEDDLDEEDEDDED